MGICLITGDHPRHKFLAAQLYQSGQIIGWVVEKREKFVPSPPEDLDEDLTILFEHHFNERDRVENEVFGSSNVDLDVPTLSLEKDQINNEVTAQFLAKLEPRLVISYGCHKLSNELMATTHCRFWNTHGGLSPDYRGVTTHFWPSYFLEPQMTGMTLHETTNFLDAGHIIFQAAAPLVLGDTLHRLAARNVEHFAKTLTPKLLNIDFDNIPIGVAQKGYGKVFMGKNWRPEHLRLIYDIYKDRIVDAVLDGQISGRTPKLVSVL